MSSQLITSTGASMWHLLPVWTQFGSFPKLLNCCHITLEYRLLTVIYDLIVIRFWLDSGLLVTLYGILFVILSWHHLLLWAQNVATRHMCRVYKNPQLYFILRHVNPVHILYKLFNIIIPSTPMSPKCLFLLSDVLTENVYMFFISTKRATCSVHLILDLIILVIFGNKYKLF